MYGLIFYAPHTPPIGPRIGILVHVGVVVIRVHIPCVIRTAGIRATAPQVRVVANVVARSTRGIPAASWDANY